MDVAALSALHWGSRVVLVSPNSLSDRLSCAVFCAEYAQLFAALIARTAKDIDVLIDSLPSEESTAALQVGVFLIRTLLKANFLGFWGFFNTFFSSLDRVVTEK